MLTVQLGVQFLRMWEEEVLGQSLEWGRDIIPLDRLAVADTLKLSPLAIMGELFGCSCHE